MIPSPGVGYSKWGRFVPESSPRLGGAAGPSGSSPWLRAVSSSNGFTLIEVLAVIAIIMVIIGLVMPNFLAMMRGHRWAAAVSNIQRMIWRARTLATNGRRDMSVEFEIDPESDTRMWIESEAQALERIPNLVELQKMIADAASYADEHAYPGSSIQGLVNLWTASGGTCDWQNGYYVNFRINQSNTVDYRYGDNARQSEIVDLATGLTVDNDPVNSPNFINWDAPRSVKWAGGDTHPDIRIGPSGSLVQTLDPVICIKRIDGEERRRVRVIRCTGRLVAE